MGLLDPQVSPLVFIYHVWMWDCLTAHSDWHWPQWLASTTTAALLPLPHHHHTGSSLPQLIFAHPTHLDEYFFFKSLVVRLPYCLILWQFQPFFVLTLVVILFMVVWGGEACLPMVRSILAGSHTSYFYDCYNILINRSLYYIINCHLLTIFHLKSIIYVFMVCFGFHFHMISVSIPSNWAYVCP